MRAREKNQKRWYKEYGRPYYLKNKKKLKKYDQKRALKTNYGMTIEDYEEMLASQKDVCAICEGRNKDGRNLFVDHDHKTGRVRGLLCSQCNFLVGSSKDSIALLKKAIQYLRHS